MVEPTALNNFKAEQCRRNAQAKSERKRQDVLAAISLLQQRGLPVTRSTIAKHAGVSFPFLSKHADLLQMIEEAGKIVQEQRLLRAADHPGKSQVIAALQRRLDTLQKQVREKDAEIRRKQKEIDQLYGKLADQS